MPGELLPGLGERDRRLRDPAQVVRELHAPSLDSPRGGDLGARTPRARAVRAARPDLRPHRRRCSRSARTRAGGASSSRASPGGRRTPCSTWRPAPGPSRSSSCGGRAAPSSASTRARTCSRSRAGGCCSRRRRRPCGSSRARAEALPFEDGDLRRAHLHLSPPLRRRPRGDAAGARARRAARRRRSRCSSSACRRRRSRAPRGSSGCASGCRSRAALLSPGWGRVGSFLGG